jgi:hypothetical protein
VELNKSPLLPRPGHPKTSRGKSNPASIANAELAFRIVAIAKIANVAFFIRFS